MATGHEVAFWKQLESSMLGPDWMVDYWDEAEDGGSTEAHRSDVNLYVVDLKTGLALAGGFSGRALESILGSVSANQGVSAAIPTQAVHEARRMGDNPAVARVPIEVKMSLLNAVGALASTRLISEVRKQRGSVNGTFVYMIYSGMAGSPFARWVFLPASGVQSMNLLQLYGVVASAVARDMADKGSAVGAKIRKIGGLDMCEVIRVAVDFVGTRS